MQCHHYLTTQARQVLQVLRAEPSPSYISLRTSRRKGTSTPPIHQTRMSSHQLPTLQQLLLALHYSHYRHTDTHPMKYHITTVKFRQGHRRVQVAQTTPRHHWMFGSPTHTSYQRMKGLQTSRPTMRPSSSRRGRLPHHCGRWSLATSRWPKASASKLTRLEAWSKSVRGSS